VIEPGLRLLKYRYKKRALDWFGREEMVKKRLPVRPSYRIDLKRKRRRMFPIQCTVK
jgi:hypothetical protein